MTTASNLQCQHCNRPINLLQAIITESGVKTNCEHCQQTFVVDKPISCNKADIAENEVINAVSPIDSHMLIHDDMEIDDAINLNPIAEYDSLEGMNAWVTKLETAPSTHINDLTHNNTIHNYPINSQATDNRAADTKIAIAIDSFDKPANSSISFNTDAIGERHHDATITRKAISSADANDIRASIATDTSDPAHENAWLEMLLQEQNPTADTAINDHEDTGLTQQLTDIGLPSLNNQTNNQAHTNKIQKRMQSSEVNSSHHNTPAISRLLWSVGSGLLILLLFMQYIIFNIDTLAKTPAVASRLQAVCSVFSCTIPSADINAFVITKPTVKATQVRNAKNFSDIQAQLVNQSVQVQLLPNLKVSIYNKDTIIGEFVAQPSDYLLSSETKLTAERRKSVMFTVPIIAKKVSKVMIEPIY